MASYSSSTTGSGSTRRQLTLQERLQLFRDMASDTDNNYRTAMTYGKLGYSQDDDEDTQVKKRIKALRNGYTNYFEQQKQREEEQKHQNEERQKQLEQSRQDSQERMEEYRKRNQQQREAREEAVQSTTSSTGITRPTTTTSPQFSRADTASNRAVRPTGQETAAQQRADRATQLVQTAQTGNQNTQTSSTNREQDWMQSQIAQNQRRAQQTEQGAASSDFQSNLYNTAKNNETDYQSQIQQVEEKMKAVNLLLSYADRVKKGDFQAAQFLSEQREAKADLLGDIARTGNITEFKSELENLARQKQELQAENYAQTLRTNQDAGTAYETRGQASQDLQDLNYLLDAAANGDSTNSERFQAIKQKYNISDSWVTDYARAARSGADEEEYPYLTGLTGEWRNVVNLRDHLADVITTNEARIQDAGVDLNYLEDYMARQQKEQEVQQQAETNRQLMQRGVPEFLAGSLVSMGSNLLSAPEALDMAIKNIGHNDPMQDDYRAYSTSDLPMTAYTQGLRQGGGEAAGNALGNLFSFNSTAQSLAQRAGNFLYGVGMSVADSAALVASGQAIFAAAGLPAAAAEATTLAIMGGSAASNTAKDAIERGATNDQAAKLSLAAGVFEATFEKLSIDRLFQQRYVGDWTKWIKETAKQAGIEASEETFTEIANICADTIIMADKSNFETARQEYRYRFMQDQGYSYEGADKAAKNAAMGDALWQVFTAGVGGALSGAAMGGVHNASQAGYSSQVLDNARMGVLPSIEEQELIKHAMVDGESLLDDANRLVREYRAQNAERIAEAKRQTQEAAGATQAQGDTTTQADAENANQGEQEGGEQAKRSAFGQWLESRRIARANSRIGARDMRTNPAESSARGYALNTASFKQLDQIARAAGVNINIVENIEGNADVDGFYHNGEIYITENALSSGRALQTTAIHETTHALKEGAPEAYQALRNAVISSMGSSEENVVRMVQNAAKSSGVNMDTETAIDEAIAIKLEEMAYNPRLFRAIASVDYNIAQKAYIGLRNFVQTMTNKKAANGGEVDSLEKIIDRWGDALKQSRQNTKARSRTTTDETVDGSPTLEGDGIQAGPTEETTQEGRTRDTKETGQEEQAQENETGENETQETEDQAPTLESEDGLQAGPAEEQLTEEQVLQQIADFEENNITLQNLQQLREDGVLSEQDYQMMSDGVRRDSGLYQRLEEIRQQNTRGTSQETGETQEAGTEAEDGTQEEQTQETAQETEDNTRETNTQEAEEQEPALVSEDGLAAGTETAQEDQRLQLKRQLLQGEITSQEYRRLAADLERQSALVSEDGLQAGPEITEEQQTETPIQEAEQEETEDTTADQQTNETDTDRIRAEMDRYEQDNPILQSLRQQLERGKTTQQEYDQARDMFLQRDQEYQRLQRQLADIQGTEQTETDQQEDEEDGYTRFRRRSVSETTARDFEEIEALRELNRKLKDQAKRKEEQAKYWRNQWKIQNLNDADEKAIAKYLEKVMAEYESEADFESIAAQITDAYKRMARAKSAELAMADDETQNILRGAAHEIVRNAWHNAYDDAYDTEQILNYFRTTPCYVSKDLDGELISRYGSLDAFRKETAGLMKITRTNKLASSPDQMITEAEHYAGRLLDHGDNEADCLFAMLDFVREVQMGSWDNPYAGMEESVAEYLANQLQEGFFDLEKVKPTKADQNLQKLKAQKELDDQRMKNALRRAKAREQRRIDELKTKQAVREAARADRMTKRELRDKIYRHANKLGQKLIRPSDKNHIPDSFKNAVTALLESLDLESQFGYTDENKQQRAPNDFVTIIETNADGTETKRTERRGGLFATQRTEKARALMAEVERLKRGESTNSESESEQNITIDPDLPNKLEMVAKLGGKQMSELSQDELKTVWETIVSLETSISKADKILGRSRYVTVSNLAGQIINDAWYDARRGGEGRQEKLNYASKTLYRIDNLLQVDQLTPETYFHRLGPAGDDLYRQMRRAQDRQVQILDEGVNHYQTAMEQAGVTPKMVRQWEEDAHTFTFDTVEGKQSITLTTGQMMELYLLSKREQAMEHLAKGGITTKTGTRTVKKGVIPVKVKNTQAGSIMLGSEGVLKIIDQLTDQQKQFANSLQAYTTGALAAHGNEASLEVYGYSKFVEKNYWPIRTKSETNKTNFEGGRDLANFANMIPSYGMAKALTPNASNAIELNNITDTFTRHLNQMATYSAWLATNENLVKVFNYKLWDNKEDGRYLSDTTKDAIKRVIGDEGQRYYQNLVFDISMGTKAGGETSFTDASLNAFKAAAVGANIRVILQQPTAIIRAAEILPAKYLLHAGSPFKAFDRAKEHSGIARWKDWGYFEMDTGRNLRELMLGEDTKLGKVKNTMMAGAGLADNFAWGILWNGVEAETRDLYPELKVGSQEFYERCNERFGEIIDRTQVVDSVLHRSDIMRSKGGLNRLATSFMSEPTKVYNMVIRDAYDIGTAQRTGDKAALRKARAHVARTAAALIASFAVNAFARAIPDYLRNEDRDKDGETFLQELWENFRSDFDPFSYVPYLRDVESVIQGFDVERSDLTGVSDLVQAANKMAKAIDGTGKDSELSAGLALARKAASAIGLPIDNLARDVTAICNSVIWGTGQHEMAYEIDKIMLPIGRDANKNFYFDSLYRVMMDDPTQYQNIYLDMLKNGFDADGIQSAMDLRLWKEAQEKWKDEEDVSSKGASVLPVEWEEPGKDEEWDAFLTQARKQDNWADLLDDDLWAVVSDLADMPGQTREDKLARRRMVADQPYTEDIKEDAMETILTASQYKKYMVAREAGLTTATYVDLLEDLEAEAAKQYAEKQAEKQKEKEKENARKLARGEEIEEEDEEEEKNVTPSITQEVIKTVFKDANLTREQKKAIWGSYFDAKSPWG